MKTNQAKRMDFVSYISMFVSFWVLIICGVIGNTSIVVPLAILIFAIASLYFVNSILERNQIRKKLVYFMLVEATQLTPYAMILLIRGIL